MLIVPPPLRRSDVGVCRGVATEVAVGRDVNNEVVTFAGVLSVRAVSVTVDR